jgi:hypothetical protein
MAEIREPAKALANHWIVSEAKSTTRSLKNLSPSGARNHSTTSIPQTKTNAIEVAFEKVNADLVAEPIDFAAVSVTTFGFVSLYFADLKTARLPCLPLNMRQLVFLTDLK